MEAGRFGVALAYRSATQTQSRAPLHLAEAREGYTPAPHRRPDLVWRAFARLVIRVRQGFHEQLPCGGKDRIALPLLSTGRSAEESTRASASGRWCGRIRNSV